MPTSKHFINRSIGRIMGLLAILVAAGCQSEAPQTSTKTASSAATAQPAMSSAPAVSTNATIAPSTVLRPPIRIKAGTALPIKDSEGNTWLADKGFADGDTIERPDLKIANTTSPAIYWAERYNMTSFTWPLPNGSYTVKLHFAETYDGITGPGQRVFSFNVAGHEFKDFDVWAKAGGPLRAYVETVPVTITDGKLLITFTPNVENPQINGIEILPAP